MLYYQGTTLPRRMLTFLVIETTHQRLSHNYPMFQHAELNTDLPWIDRKFTNVTKGTDIDFGREILEGVRGRRVQETSFLNFFIDMVKCLQFKNINWNYRHGKMCMA